MAEKITVNTGSDDREDDPVGPGGFALPEWVEVREARAPSHSIASKLRRVTIKERNKALTNS